MLALNFNSVGLSRASRSSDFEINREITPLGPITITNFQTILIITIWLIS